MSETSSHKKELHDVQGAQSGSWGHRNGNRLRICGHPGHPDYRIYSRMLASGTRRSSSGFDPYAILAASIAKAQIKTENRRLTTSPSIFVLDHIRVMTTQPIRIHCDGEPTVHADAQPNTNWYPYRKRNGYRFRLSARNIASGGMYPDTEAKMPVELPREFGFCDSPWKRLVLSDGRLQPCGLDRKGSLAYTAPGGHSVGEAVRPLAQ
jgi:hypothetical protein